MLTTHAAAVSPVYFEPDPSSDVTGDAQWVIVYCDLEAGETLISGQLQIINDVDDGSGGEGVDHAFMKLCSGKKSEAEGFGWESVSCNITYVEDGHIWIVFYGPQIYDTVLEEWVEADGGYFGPYEDVKKIRLCRIRVEANSTLTPGISPLQFSSERYPPDCPICTYSQIDKHGGGATPAEWRNGTYFHYADNALTSCNDTGWPKDEFMPNDAVYVLGRGLAASTNYDLWIQNDSVTEGETLSTAGDPSGLQEDVATDADGDFGPTEIWDDVGDGAPNYYDIVADNEDGTYHAADDYIDDALSWGFMAPVPELPAIALVSVGLLGLIGAIWRRRYD